jgi:hypothetical protein
VSKYSYSASLDISAHLLYNLSVWGILSWPARTPSKNRAVGCAPCTDPNLTLKEQMKKLDDIELVNDNEGTCDKTYDNK